MRHVVFILALSVLLLEASFAGPLDQKALKGAMAYGEVTRLNDIETNFDKKLALRLYEVPQFDGTCFEETHGVCKNRYYLSVSTFDAYPEANVFKLNLSGEVVDIEWVETDGVDYAELKLVHRPFTEAALSNNSSLTASESVTKLQVTPDKLTEQTR